MITLITAGNIPEGWFHPDPPPDRYPRPATFQRRGWYYGQARRVALWGTLRNGHRVVLRHCGGHTTGPYRRPRCESA